MRDCETALGVTKSHMKAVVSGAQCCDKLKLFKDCVEWCDKGLGLDNMQEELVRLRADSAMKDKAAQRDARKRLAADPSRRGSQLRVNAPAFPCQTLSLVILLPCRRG